jgi:hypothetical protein
MYSVYSGSYRIPLSDGELVDRLQLSLFTFSITKLKLIIYFRKYHNGLPFWHSASGILMIHDSILVCSPDPRIPHTADEFEKTQVSL